MKVGQQLTFKSFLGADIQGVVLEVGDKEFIYQVFGGKTTIQDYVKDAQGKETTDAKGEQVKAATREIDCVQTVTHPIEGAEKTFTFL